MFYTRHEDSHCKDGKVQSTEISMTSDKVNCPKGLIQIIRQRQIKYRKTINILYLICFKSWDSLCVNLDHSFKSEAPKHNVETNGLISTIAVPLTWQCTMNSQFLVRSLASRERFMSQRRVYWGEEKIIIQRTSVCPSQNIIIQTDRQKKRK